jgi:hypothetical protein
MIIFGKRIKLPQAKLVDRYRPLVTDKQECLTGFTLYMATILWREKERGVNYINDRSMYVTISG